MIFKKGADEFGKRCRTILKKVPMKKFNTCFLFIS